ncbi:hypothetical protein FPCIR_5798 [Fusarium pseudocircinatum]|uniref:Uncharacterized protein n=1 Tax=Fusarium pseudocircinatum TaxID=56676 RepID=A0A8H5P8K7_9HYPO|nr:hypothetical protein FPCIR_5798 [Fusarium pseudocircinatum]
MLPVESKDLELLVKHNSILILDIDCWGASYLRNVLAYGSANITTKQGNKTLPSELWLDILDWVEYYVDENTYKQASLRCIDVPSYKLDPEMDDVDQDEEPFFTITKTVQGNAYSIPLSHLGFKGDFLFDNIEVPDMIARCENGDCSLCGGDRYLDSTRPTRREEALMFCNETEFHRQCYCHGVVCPLCIGGEYADAYLEILKSRCRNGDRDDDEEEEETEDEKSEKKRTRNWIRERYRELGYGRFSY